MTENDMTPSSPGAPQATEINPALHPTQTPDSDPPASGKPSADRKKRIILIGGLVTVGALLFGFLYFSSMQPRDETPATPTPTEMPTPTPTPNVSRIATTSAFAAYSAEIASFSATVNSFTLQDSTLAPPILDLDLGLNE
ncbi:MAG TPA: hypothetical protein VJB96_00475 [Patescibacteria group bacterium]|nr:hypothetical protein [Patescibacteria group bacterium]